MRPSPGLRVRVYESGWMELLDAERGSQMMCDEAGTAMWVALARQNWCIGDAAAHLAEAWDEDPWAVRDLMVEWTEGLHRSGLLDR